MRASQIARRRILTGGIAAALLTHRRARAASKARSFKDRLLPAPVDGGFSMPGYWVWCGSAIEGPDGKFHLFASRWPRALAFHPHWLTNSEVVRAVADRPEGPYEFQEAVLPPREDAWDARMTHNPTIHKSGDTYLLFYTGTTYDGAHPTEKTQERNGSPRMLQARANQRIGLATSKSLAGPWKRFDRPVLEPRTGKWDALMTTNAGPCVLPDGSVLLVYKSTAHQGDLLRLGVARAKRFDGPYQRLKDGQLFDFDATKDHVEDPYVWREGGLYHLVMKDMRGGISGEKHAGIYATSRDGVSWKIANPPLAYSRTVRWSDGTTTTQGHLERPQVLLRNGKPTHIFFATGDGPGGFGKMTRTWTMVLPIGR